MGFLLARFELRELWTDLFVDHRGRTRQRVPLRLPVWVALKSD